VIHHPTGVLDDGRKVTVEMYRQITREELAKLRAQYGEAAFAAGNYERAARIIDEITSAEAFETFLTCPRTGHRLTEFAHTRNQK